MTDHFDHDPTLDELPAELRELLADESAWATPPAELLPEVLATIAAERSAPEEAATSADPGVGATNVVPLAAPADRRPRGPLIWVAVAVAAAVVAVAGVAIRLAVSPDNGTLVASVELAAPGGASDAHGEGEVRSTPSGFRVELDVDLAPAPEGTYYQAWLKSPGGEAITIGTFHARQGGGDIVLWSGVDPHDYPLLTVTRQLIGEGPASSGVVVLSGPIDFR